MLMQLLLLFFDKYFIWLHVNVIKVAQNTVKSPRLDDSTRLLHTLNKFMLLLTNLKHKGNIKWPNKILEVFIVKI